MTKSRFINNDGTVYRARRLRRDSTPAEKGLWAVLRGRGLGGWKFRRQQRIGRYTVDFVCQAARLVVEVDGDSHAFSADADRDRTRFLEAEGYRMIRFANADVLHSGEGVWRMIEIALAEPSPSHPALPGGALPLPQGERE